MGMSNYSTHCAMIIDDVYIDYTWGGVRVETQDFLVERIWEVELEVEPLVLNQVQTRVVLLRDLLPKGFWHWWGMAIGWLFYKEQYICTNFVMSVLGEPPCRGLTPDELYYILN